MVSDQLYTKHMVHSFYLLGQRVTGKTWPSHEKVM